MSQILETFDYSPEEMNPIIIEEEGSALFWLIKVREKKPLRRVTNRRSGVDFGLEKSIPQKKFRRLRRRENFAVSPTAKKSWF